MIVYRSLGHPFTPPLYGTTHVGGACGVGYGGGHRWNSDGTQILVVPRKLQDVLLHHFAFDKGRSLLKQLNAYGFVSVRATATMRGGESWNGDRALGGAHGLD